MELLAIGAAAKLTGLHPQTLRKYADDGRVPVVWTPTGKERRFDRADLLDLMGVAPQARVRVEAHYVRVSGSTGQEASLDDQTARLAQTATGAVYRVYRDKGSGLSTRRRGLQRLLADAKAGKFTHVRVVYPDRLARFGVEWLTELFAAYGVELEVLDDASFKSPHEELLADFMSLLASFSGKFYKLRSLTSQRQLLADASGVLAAREHE